MFSPSLIPGHPLWQVRPALQTLIRKALSSESTSLPSGGADDVFAQMMIDISKNKSDDKEKRKKSTLPPKMIVKQIVGNPTLVQTCESWLHLNNAEKVVNHPSYSKYLSIMKTVTGCTCDEWDAPSCPFHESSTTLGDFVRALANAFTFDACIPMSVPVLGSGSLMHSASELSAYKQRKDAAREAGEVFKKTGGGGLGR